ncbi:hypothetical protein M9H77_18921 [Catharanthus roseus]|uniref:Uncharacterized protein n=1 Tax=Catharanthus roseus TaxID=4058 RepID=A0ACC0B935_CATRO|nr:hypothetical protein M9H77_18921 [Catharanthus roseus]
MPNSTSRSRGNVVNSSGKTSTNSLTTGTVSNFTSSLGLLSKYAKGRPAFLDISGVTCYPVSIAETHPHVAHEPIEVHGWFLSVRASEALSHQSFAIPRSLKAANIALRASSYLRVS